MKIADGMFHNVFNQIAKEYPDITSDHYIIDIGTARLAAKPEIFDVIVTLNLYGDIISDVAAEISGSVGLAGSANIGKEYAMFEAIHGSAPDIAGQNIANPTGLIQASVMMLVHLGQADIANKIRNALFKTIEDGLHTPDIYNEKTSKQKLGTQEFAEAVIANLGYEPQELPKANFKNLTTSTTLENQASTVVENIQKSLIGFDLFIDWQDEFDALLALIKTLESEKFEIKMITAKGLVLWPQIDKHNQPTYPKGQTILRFIGKGITGKNSNDIIAAEKFVTHQNLIEVLNMFVSHQVDFIKYEGLYLFNGKPGYSSGQGE